MDLPDSVRSLLGSSSTPDPEERATRLDGGQVVAEGQEQIAIELPEDSDVDASQIEAALNGNAGSVNVRGQAGGDTTVTPVASGTDIHITDSAFDLSDWEYKAYLDDQIVNLMENRVDYNQQTGQWILANDDLIPGVLIRLKSLMLGQQGLEVKPSDPDSEADQRLADHLERVYEGDPDVDSHVDPGKVMDRILEQNVMNAVFVGRSTDLQHLDVADLNYVKDGETGEEIYIQDATSYTTFEIEEDGEPSVDIEYKEEETALEIGKEVVDVRLYRTPPLQAVADDVVNKMQLKRLQGRKAELASIGGVIIKVNPPAWLPEEDYGNYVRSEDDDFGDQEGRMLELVMAQQIDSALETLESYQTATVMSIPENWETDTIELPEMDESMSSMIRDYNEAISRRLLLPLDLIELQDGPELSRNTMMQMFLDMVAGWQGQITDMFDQFAQVQAEIHGISGSVDHELPPIEAQDEKQILQLFNFAGLLGLSEAESRELANVLEGVDLETDQTGDMPPEGGPEDQEERFQQMRDALQDDGGDGDGDGPGGGASDGPDDGADDGDSGDSPPDQQAAGGSSNPEPQGSAADVPLVAAASEDLGEIELPTTCRMCDERTRMKGNFRCPDCHPEVDADQFDGELAAAGSYSEGEEVDTPAGQGVVVEVRTEDFDGPDGPVEASEDDPAYIVGVEGGVEVYRASDLSDGEIDADVDNPTGDLVAAKASMAQDPEAAPDWLMAARGDGRFSYPDSWEESDTPARLILLKAWAGMNGQFDCGGDCCKGEMMSSGMSEQAANRFCASMKDRVMGGWEGWRKGAASASVQASHGFSGFETRREAAAHVRDLIEKQEPEGHTTEMRKRDDDTFAILVRDRQGNFQGSVLVREAETEEDQWLVIGGEDYVLAARNGTVMADWDPDAHPRGPNGQFVESLAEYREAIKDSIRDVDVDAEDESMADRATSKFQDTADEEVDRFKNPVVAENTFGSIGELFVNDFRTGINFQAGRGKDESSFEVQPASRPTTFHHEYGHAIADGHGYGISVDAAREGDMQYDSDQDNFVPVDLDRDDLDEFKLTQLEGEDPPEEVQNLMEAVNSAWEEAQRVGQESPEDLEDYVPKTNYGTLNAHEFLAQLHESLQMDRLPENANWFYRYDDLLPAYLEVAEPSDRVKELITFLHNNREGSPFDEDPYPEIEPEV